MPSKLKRAVERETAFRYQDRCIIIRLEEGGRVVKLRQKGLRTWYTVTVEQIFWTGASNKARSDKEERKRLRAERKASRQ